jgi:predicted dehydrogenase
VPVIEVRRGEFREEIVLTPEDSYRLELENVSDAIDGKAELLLGREDAVAQARAIEALYRSAGEGKAVTLGG